jgi:hypothetical protein
MRAAAAWASVVGGDCRLQCDVHGSIVDRLQGLEVRVALANVSHCIDDGLMISLRLVIIEGHVTDRSGGNLPRDEAA